MSQLSLAHEAEVSPKHVSFLETGRSTPSREMVLRLCDVLEVPYRQRNVLLDAAGFSVSYRESSLDDPELQPVLKAVGTLLERHDPYPAIMVDSHWFVLRQNNASMNLVARFAEEPTRPEFNNVLRLLFHDKGLRPWVVNWSQIGTAMIQRLHREAATQGDDSIFRELLDELLNDEHLPRDWRFANLDNDLSVVLPFHLKRGDLEVRLYTALTTLGTALDVTLNELKIETFLPVDEESDRVLKEWTPT